MASAVEGVSASDHLSPYEIETSEGDDGTAPVAWLWTPNREDAADHGFIVRRGPRVAGIDDPIDDRHHSIAFILLAMSQGLFVTGRRFARPTPVGKVGPVSLVRRFVRGR
ncbi:hypothetical protein [Streptomyces coeruleorubidus]|uniref:hypothetical protein n=1 Tax=Streptomyces coeruleorubidus TaxID=116188 RepID=UPI00369688B7